MRRKTVQTLAISATMIGVASMAIAASGEYEALMAWWMVILLLLPPVMWALDTPYVALKTICLIAFTGQFVTVPIFYMDRDSFSWGHLKPFGFNAMEAWPMLLKIALFLVFLVIFFKVLYSFKNLEYTLPRRSKKNHLSGTQPKLRSFFLENTHSLKPSRNAWIYVGLILLVTSVASGLNLWMFSQGISIVGVEPPQLPYRLSGILHYLTRYTIPLLLGYLFWKTKRGFLPMAVLMGYALILGLSSVSRSALAYVMLPVLLAAWYDKRWVLLTVAGLGLTIGFSLVTMARNFVYIVDNGKTGAVTDINILTIFTNIVWGPDSPLVQGDFLLRAFAGIFNRMDGFEIMVMSHFYDPYAVLEPVYLLLGMIWRQLAPIDNSLHSMEWQGSVPPDGFYSGGVLLSNVVILGNANLLWVIASAFVVASTLVLLEKSAHRVIASYGLPDLLASALIIFLTIIFFNETGGSSIFLVPMLILTVASWLPPLYRFNRL
jgi:hypothetical protein